MVKNNPLIFITVVVFGIMIGLGLNSAIKNSITTYSKYSEIYESLKYKTDAQEPVLKAMRLLEYKLEEDALLLRFEVLKIRECGFPMSMSFTYVDHEGRVHRITDLEIVDTDGDPGIMQGLAKLNPTEWQKTDWFKIRPPVDNASLYLTLQHTCQVKFYNKQEDIIDVTDAETHAAIDIVSKTYGPFEIGAGGKTLDMSQSLSKIRK
jgi:hypothetical protein